MNTIAILDMDGNIISKHQTAHAATVAVAKEQRKFRKTQSNGSLTQSYLPRHIVDLSHGDPRRQGQHSTKWVCACGENHDVELENE